MAITNCEESLFSKNREAESRTSDKSFRENE